MRMLLLADEAGSISKLRANSFISFLLFCDVIMVSGRGAQRSCWVETSCSSVVVVYEGEMDCVATGSREKMRR